MTFYELGYVDKEREDAGRRLIAKMVEVQRLCHGPRSYDGPLEPVTPRLVFQAVFCLPLRSTIHPLENYGVVQRLVNSKDGKYLMADFGQNPRFWRAAPNGDEAKATGLLREIRELAGKTQAWVTLVDEDGSFFPQQLLPTPGMLYPAPSEPRTVDLEDYLAAIAEHDKDATPGFLESDFSPRVVDYAALAKLGDVIEITDEKPASCTECAAELVPSRRRSVPGLEEAVDCPKCKVVYLRVKPEVELNDAELAEANRRDAVFGEFCRRIEEEFPIPDDAIGGEQVA